MGLSYGPKYTWTNHFEKRAQERFGVNEERPEERKYISDYGVIFVCNTVEQKFITCYEAKDIILEGKKVTIHDYNVDLFRDEVENLARKYCLKDAKEMLCSVEDHLHKFQEISQKLISGRLTKYNYNLITNLIDEFHVIKSAMRVIETKRGDFKI